MKRTVYLILILAAVFSLFSTRASAQTAEAFDESIEELKNSVSGDVRERMSQLGYDGTEISEASDITVSSALKTVEGMICDSAAGPMAACAILTAVIILSSLLESYTFSLRYADTKEVMNVVSSLLIIATLVTPITALIRTSMETVRSTASLMLVYVPIMIGIMAFSGHVISSGGYYATVMTASQGIAQLTNVLIAPLLNLFLAISVSSAISERVKLNGICELLSKLIKWTLAFSMTIFTAVLSIRGFAANAADSVASKTLRFTFSSFIPVVGASISDAYKAIESSVGLLRSGVGVFVIIAVIAAFLPIILQIMLWQLSVMIAKTVATTFSVDSTAAVLNAIGTVLSVMMAVIACLTSVFLISTGVLLSIGGGS